MMQAVQFIIVMIGLLGWPSSIYVRQKVRAVPLTYTQLSLMTFCYTTAAVLSLTIWGTSMRSGVRALERMGD